MLKFIFITILALTLAGCKSDGSGSVLSSIFGSSSNGSSAAVITSNAATNSPTSGGSEVVTYHNPEPSTMILFGVGLASLAGLALRKKKGKG